MALLLLTAASSAFSAEGPAHIRAFRQGATYSPAMTFSPLGNVVLRNNGTPGITVLDGFSRQNFVVPEESSFRVFQSRSGQLWCLALEGVLLHHNGEWTLHPIPEIRDELQRSPIRQLRQIALLPAEVNHLLILLNDRLIDYDAGTRRVGILKHAAETRLERFHEISEANDGSVWVSGKRGLATMEGPVRKLTAETPWREFLLPADSPIGTLHRPHSRYPGEVTTVGTSEENERFLIRLIDGEWSVEPIDQEKVRQAWTDWDRIPWGYSYNSLLRFESLGRPRKEPVAGAQYDMAVEPNGAFWITSSEGLVRYAPFLWRVTPPLHDFEGSVHSFYFQNRTNIWMATSQGLLNYAAERVRIYRWPEEIETLVNPAARLHSLPGQRLLISTESQLLVFDTADGRFSSVPFQEAKVRIVGAFNDRTLCAWIPREDSGSLDLRKFDGATLVPLELPEVEWEFDQITTIKEARNGDLWIGSTSGILHVRASRQSAEVHSIERGLPPSERIGVIEEVGDGRIWSGTASRIYEYRASRWQPVINTPDRVTSIVRGSDSVWVSTAAGVYRHFGDAWIYYSPGEGLPSEIVYTLASDPLDEIWAGTSRGAVKFHSDADRDPPRVIPPTVGNRAPSTVEPTVIEFRGQDKWDYTRPNELLYSYRLDEGAWSPFTNLTRRIFENLSSGNHVLEVLAMDKNGNRSPTASTIEFSVIVPWFRDPRLLAVSILGGCVTLFLAGLAVNKHLQLKRSYARVEQIVTERTRELQRANEELLHGQKMRAIGTMAAGIAHDFNNILSIIKGSAQIIESNVDDKEKIRTRVDRIQTVVEQGTSIVKALLGLGRMNEKEMTPCDLAEMLRNTKKLLADRFPDTVNIEIETQPALRPVICSREAIEQMLLNFILNGVDAMNNKGTLKLWAAEVELPPEEMVVEPAQASRYAVLSVRDEGAGIPENILPRIFEPFFTTKSFSSRRGTGLGLSMVYELAKGMGYGLKVQSKPGEGSTFSIILPVSE